MESYYDKQERLKKKASDAKKKSAVTNQKLTSIIGMSGVGSATAAITSASIAKSIVAKVSSMNVTQSHTGSGDNIGGSSINETVIINGIVMYTKTDSDKNITLIIKGGVVGDVECCGHIVIEKGDIEGCVEAGESVTCKGDIKGGVECQGGITVRDITGDVEAQGDINATTINGSVSAQGNINCKFNNTINT